MTPGLTSSRTYRVRALAQVTFTGVEKAVYDTKMRLEIRDVEGLLKSVVQSIELPLKVRDRLVCQRVGTEELQNRRCVYCVVSSVRPYTGSSIVGVGGGPGTRPPVATTVFLRRKRCQFCFIDPVWSGLLIRMPVYQ